MKTWWEAGYVVIFGTYMGYILTMVGQHSLRPTVVSIYNYVQPIVSVTVSVLTGIGVFTVDGKMIDIAFYDGAKRTIALAKASGVVL